MGWFFVGMIPGFILGAVIGVLIMCILQINRDGDDHVWAMPGDGSGSAKRVEPGSTEAPE